MDLHGLKPAGGFKIQDLFMPVGNRPRDSLLSICVRANDKPNMRIYSRSDVFAECKETEA
jgi:hypothetical protein